MTSSVCSSCGHRPRSPGIFQVFHIVPSVFGTGTEKFFRDLCARCIPDRLTFRGKIVVESVS